jgi:hypothetical protein
MLHYPFEFYLEDGARVVVNTINTVIYQFSVAETNGNNFNFDWHVFRGIEDQTEQQIVILKTYIKIVDEHRVVAMN